jgi:hypothetical protein
MIRRESHNDATIERKLKILALAVEAEGRRSRLRAHALGGHGGLGRVRHCINNNVLLLTDFAVNDIKSVLIKKLKVAICTRISIDCRDGVACRLPCHKQASLQPARFPSIRFATLSSLLYSLPSRLALITRASTDSISLLTYDLTVPDLKAALPKRSCGTMWPSLVWRFGYLDIPAVPMRLCRNRGGRREARGRNNDLHT